MNESIKANLQKPECLIPAKQLALEKDELAQGTCLFEPLPTSLTDLFASGLAPVQASLRLDLNLLEVPVHFSFLRMCFLCVFADFFHRKKYVRIRWRKNLKNQLIQC